MYLPAMGDLGAADFNATKYPGVAKPSTAGALAIFKNLQSQLNRIAHVKGLSKIGVDGDLGPGTVTLFKQVQNAAQADAVGGQSVTAAEVAEYNNTSAAIIATAADDSSVSIQNYADYLGAPATVPGKLVISPTTLVAANGTEIQVKGAAANLADSFGSWSDVEKLAAVGLVGTIGYLAFTRRKKTKAARVTTRSTRR